MTLFSITTLSDELFNGLSFEAELADGGGLSLREAIGLANTGAYGAVEVRLADALSGASVLVTEGLLTVSADLTLSDLSVDAGDDGLVILVGDGGVLSLDGLYVDGDVRINAEGDGALRSVSISVGGNLFVMAPSQDGSGAIWGGAPTDPDPAPTAELTAGTITITAGGDAVIGTPVDPAPTIPSGPLTAGDIRVSTSGGAPSAAPITAFATAAPTTSAPTTFIVDTFDDQLFDGGTLAEETADGGGLTLREAIGLANSAEYTGTDEILIADAIAGQSVQLTHGELVLSSSMNITGDLTLDGRGLARVMNASGGTSTLTGLTLTDGAAIGKGGGLLIANGASMTLNDVTVSDNTAAGGAGGIWVAGGATLNARDTAVTGNTTGGYGGGMIVNGAAIMVNAEIGGNTAGNWGGGVDLDLGGSLTLINATVHGNTAGNGGAGVDAWNGALFIDASTFTGNTAGGRGGAIYMSVASDSLSTIANSIFAGNSASAETTGRDLFLAGTDVNFGDNIILGTAARTTTTTGTFALTGAGSHELESDGVALSDVFAQIDGATGGGLAADNGGAVRTVALTLDAANIAIGGGGALDLIDMDGDALVDDPLPVGANGATREGALGSDIGAYQTSLVVNTLLDVTDLTDGVTTLREAIEFAGGVVGAAPQITFDAGVFAGGQTITLTEGQLSVFSAMSIDGDVDGDGRADVTIDAGGLSRVLGLTAGADAAINGLVITGGNASSGGGIHMVGAAALTLTGSTITGNSTAGNGAGIEVNTGSTLHAKNVVIADNTAIESGGGVMVFGDAVLVNVDITGNTATYGGGIGLAGGTLELTNATVHGNAASSSGGGVDAYSGALTMHSSTVTGNSAAGSGGGIYAGSGMTAEMSNSIIAGNTGASGNEVDLHAAITNNGGLILGSAAQLASGVADPGAIIAASTDLFAATDAGGGGIAANNGGYGRTVALKIAVGNAALGGAISDPALTAKDTLDLDGDGDTAEQLPHDASGAARDRVNGDIGALEAGPVDTPSLIVTTADDVVDENDGLISLREAVATANSGALTGTITFDMSLVDQVLVLTGGEIVLTGDVAIDGDIVGDGLDHNRDGVVDIFDRDGVADIHIDGGGAGRIFNITAGSADLHGLVLENGDAGDGYGGAIRVKDAGLVFSNGEIRDNAAQYGGGLYGFNADITLVNVEIRDNNASYGGGVGVWTSDLSMASVTIAGNDATNSAGGLLSIENTVDLTNLTIANNDAGGGRGGAWFYQTSGTIVQSTVTGNTAATGVGGVQVDGVSTGLMLANSIIAANVGGAGAADLQVVSGGAATLAGTVLLGAAADVDAGSSLTMDGTLLTLSDMPETIDDVFFIEPDGSPSLFDAGGWVRTVSLRINADNPAHASGDPAFLPADIHDLDGDGDVAEALPIGATTGAIRLDAPDLGAAPLPPYVDVASLVVTTTADLVNPWDGVISLREAIATANDGTLSGTITFASGAGQAFAGGGTITLGGSELLLTRGDITIDGDIDDDGVADVVIDAGGLSRVLHIAPVNVGATVIAGLVITGGVASGGAGVLIENVADVTFVDTQLLGNTATGGGGEESGGGILVDGALGTARVVINGGAIMGNAADLGGGVAAVDDADIVVVGTLIANNFATSFGGGLVAFNRDLGSLTSAEIFVINSTIANNTALEGGGGFAGASNTFTDIVQSTVTGNAAAVGAAVLIVDEALLAAQDAGLPPPETINAGHLGIGLSIIAGNGTVPATEIVTHDPAKTYIAGAILAGKPFDLVNLASFDVPDFPIAGAGGTIYTFASTILSETLDLDLLDIFDAIDPVTGGGQLALNGGRHETAALKASFSNPAMDASQTNDPGRLSEKVPLLSLPYALLDANGTPRDSAFLDPAGLGFADVGAVEALRQPLTDLFAALPDGAPVLADLSGGASGPSGDAALFDGAAFLDFGTNDRLVFDGAATPGQFSFAGNMLTYDADGDGDPEAQTFVSLADDVAGLVFTATPGGVSATAAPKPIAIGEVVTLTVGTSWQTLSFANTYKDAVVFALAPSLNELDSAATRFRNITGDGGEIRLQEPKTIVGGLPNTSGHVDETVTLVVMEKGTHILEDGTIIQVGELQTSKLYVKGFEDVAFDAAFATSPSIFSQVQTFDGTDFIISRQRAPDANGFQLTMQEEEADNRNHATETVGWMAIEHGSGSLSTMDWQVGSSAQNVNGNLTPVYFNARFDEKPLVMASLASYNGTDTASPRIGAVAKNAFTALALEDQSFDAERFHGPEIIDWMAFSNEGSIFSGEVIPTAGAQKIVASGFASTGNQTITVDFRSAFDNPVVIATMTSRNGTQEAVARVSNVTSTSFDIRIQETDALDGNHGAEDISWIVVEAGTWQLADGTIIQAGLADIGATTRQSFTSIGFDASFTADPAVLSQTQTETDTAFVKTRMQGVDTAGFAVALEEEEAASWGGHGTETVGWIAVDMGQASDVDGFVFEAGEVATNHNWKAETFDAIYGATPGLVAGMATFNASDTAATRIRALTDTGFEIAVEEDTSLNAETGHGTESFHWIAFNGEGELWGDALV
jgi:predicted outer membrane repeat protein